MADLRTTIVGILKADHPQTVRQVFYQLVTRGAVEKTEGEYSRTVVRLLSEMRLDGQISWDWITDESRTRQVTRTFDNVADALNYTAQHYRRSALQKTATPTSKYGVRSKRSPALSGTPPANMTCR